MGKREASCSKLLVEYSHSYMTDLMDYKLARLPCEKPDDERAERREHSCQRRERREELLAEHQRGYRIVNGVVIPLDRDAHRVGGIDDPP